MEIMNMKHATFLGRNMNIRKLLERKVRQHRDKPFIIFIDKDMKEEILTYQQFDEKVNRLANWILSRGIKKGDFVLTHLPNSPGFLIALHACTKIGVAMIPSIIFDVAEELEYKLNFSEAKMVITDGEYFPRFDSIRDQCKTVKDIVIYRSAQKISGTHAWADILASSSPELDPVEIDPLDTAMMLFTSGTTARPKGVVLTHANFIYNGEICTKNYAIGPHDRILLIMPLFHVNAQGISWFPTLTAGASIVVCEQFDGSKFSQLARSYDCTFCSLVAANLRMILAEPEHPLDGECKMWRCAYAIAIPDAEWDAFEKRFNTMLLDLYGLTEVAGANIIMPIWGEHRRGSVGWSNYGLEVMILDNDRNEVPVGQAGEIVLKGQPGITLFKEYYKNPEAAPELADGLFYTGDYGKIDEDGYCYFIDRKKDIIRRAAENISAPEVERVLNEHPDVAESCVIAVPDSRTDEAVMAIVRCKEGHSATDKELALFCQTKMAKFKIPEYWIVQKEEFPKTSIGKIQKVIVRSGITENWDTKKYTKIDKKLFKQKDKS
jgi:crotonobetaine/carnitine-CoA ligase